MRGAISALVALLTFPLGATGNVTARPTGAPTAAPTPEPTPDPMLGIATESDVVYATVDGEPLRLDIYRSADAGPEKQPVLLFFHGGGWVSGSRLDAVPENDPRRRGVAKGWDRSWPSMLPYVRRGLTLVSASYRLGPKHPEPAAIEDAFRALAWVGREGPSRNLDPTRVVIAGVSAGGHLALLVGFTEASGDFFPVDDLGSPRPTIRGVVDLYGVSDVADLLVGPHAKPFTSAWIPSKSVERARELSPLRYVHDGVPPVLIVHGSADDVVPVAQSRRLAEKLDAQGDLVDLVVVPDAPHGWFDAKELLEIERAIVGFFEQTGVIEEAD